MKEPSINIFAAELRKEDSLDAVRDAMIDTIENAAKTPPTKEEVERAKASRLKQIELNLNDPN